MQGEQGAFYNHFQEALNGLLILLEDYQDGYELEPKTLIEIQDLVFDSIATVTQTFESYVDYCFNLLEDQFDKEEYSKKVSSLEQLMNEQFSYLLSVIEELEELSVEERASKPELLLEGLTTAFYGLMAPLEELSLLMAPSISAPAHYRPIYDEFYRQVYLLSQWLENPLPEIKENLLMSHEALIREIEQFSPENKDVSKSESVIFESPSDPVALIEQAIHFIEEGDTQIPVHPLTVQTDTLLGDMISSPAQECDTAEGKELDAVLTEMELDLDRMLDSAESMLGDGEEDWLMLKEQVQTSQIVYLDDILLKMRESLNLEEHADVHLLVVTLQSSLRQWSDCFLSSDSFELKKQSLIDGLQRLNGIYYGL